MRRSDTQDIQSVIKAYLKEMKFDHKIKEIKAVRLWYELTGKAVSSRTKNAYVKDKKLFIELNSSVARQELQMIKDQICTRINEEMKEQVIQDIVLR